MVWINIFALSTGLKVIELQNTMFINDHLVIFFDQSVAE